MILPRGTWSAAHGVLSPKVIRPDRPLVLRRRGDDALAIPALRLGEWFYAVVSRDDAWAAAFNWYVTKAGYVQRNAPKLPGADGRHGRTEYLHRLVHSRVAYGDDRGFEPTTLIDHRDRNPLINLRRNLRVLDQSEQNRNQTRNAREDVGVTWDETRGRWMATIAHAGRDIFVGRFRNKRQAIAARATRVRALGEAAA